MRDDADPYWTGRRHGGKPGDRRAGCRLAYAGQRQNSFSMLFYAARVVRHPAMQNPTLVVLHRSQRPRRPAFRPVPTLRGHSRSDAGPGERPASICASC